MGERKILYRTIIASVLVHLLLVLLIPGLTARTPVTYETRVQLALTDPDDSRGMFTETPESARVPEPPPDAANLAEHNAQAQNPEPAPDVDGRPRSEGDLELYDFRPADLLTEDARRRQPSPASQPTPQTPEAERQVEEQPEQEVAERQQPEQEEAAAAERSSGDVRLAGAEAQQRTSEGAPPTAPSAPSAPAGGKPRPRHDAPISGVSATGELSLSTYEWPFAPYLRHLRDSIDERWKPPFAFYMGLLEGDGAISFRVHPDGRVSLIEVVAEEGHASLARAARNAIDYAAPFNALPADFPDPYLDVTWHYRYVIVRR